MPKFSDVFPSKYLRAADLNGKYIQVEITRVDITDVGGNGKQDDTKPVAQLKGRTKRFVLNKTNGATLAKAFGDEMNDWVGKTIEIYPDVTQMQGRTVDCLRCRQPLELDPDDNLPM